MWIPEVHTDCVVFSVSLSSASESDFDSDDSGERELRFVCERLCLSCLLTNCLLPLQRLRMPALLHNE